MPAEDKFDDYQRGVSAPASDAFAITPDDAGDLIYVTRALYVGTAGDVSVVMRDGGTVVFTNVNGGTTLPCCVSRVMATGTTASGLVGMV